MDRFDILTAKYLDGALSAAESDELLRLLDDDPESSDQFVSFYAQDRLLALKYEPANSDAIDAIMAQLKREEDPFVRGVLDGIREVPAPVEPRAFSLGQWIERLIPTRGWMLATAAAIVLVLAIIYFSPTQGEPVLGRVAGGTVQVQRAGQTLAAQPGMHLEANDVVQTDNDGITILLYGREATKIELRPNTQLKLALWEKGKRFELRLGKIEASVARQRPFKPLLVRTPNAEARVLGTKFTLAAATNRTRLDVTEGRVRLTSASDGAVVKVGPGQYAEVADGTKLAALPQTGSLLCEIWTGIPGGEVNDLLDHPDYPNRPTHRDFLKTFETPVIQTNNYACRLIGYIHPPVTGDYTFWIASGGYSALWLSPDENPAGKVRIATAPSLLPRQWWDASSGPGKLMMPRSPIIRLVAGRRYFIEAVEKTATNSSHLEVAWRIPGAEREIISGEFLSPFKGKP
jgi:hypothetical protein